MFIIHTRCNVESLNVYYIYIHFYIYINVHPIDKFPNPVLTISYFISYTRIMAYSIEGRRRMYLNNFIQRNESDLYI